MADGGFENILAEHNPSDSRASQEAKYLYTAKKREEELRMVMHKVTLVAMFILALVAGVIFLIRVAHFVMPDSWKWLSDVQLQSIDKFFFSGALGGIFVKHIGKLFKHQPEHQ